MGHRLTQIATRTGDDGTTGLGDGARVPKDHLRIHALGDVDELNSNLGVLLAEPLPDDVRALLVAIQHELFNLGGELSIPGYELLKADAVVGLDEALARGRGGGSVRSSPSPRPSRSTPRPGSTSTGCPTCCSCLRGS